jgi:hypothetical protein
MEIECHWLKIYFFGTEPVFNAFFVFSLSSAAPGNSALGFFFRL